MLFRKRSGHGFTTGTNHLQFMLEKTVLLFFWPHRSALFPCPNTCNWDWMVSQIRKVIQILNARVIQAVFATIQTIMQKWSIRNMQVGGGGQTLLHDELMPIMKLHPKEHLISTVPLQLYERSDPNLKEEFAFSALNQMQVHLQDNWQNNFHFLLSSFIITSDRTSCLFIHFTVWYSSLNLQYEQSLWKHYKQNNLLKNQTRTRRTGVRQDEEMKLILEGGKTCSWERPDSLRPSPRVWGRWQDCLLQAQKNSTFGLQWLVW